MVGGARLAEVPCWEMVGEASGRLLGKRDAGECEVSWRRGFVLVSCRRGQ
jgi:hypothetical protein